MSCELRSLITSLLRTMSIYYIISVYTFGVSEPIKFFFYRKNWSDLDCTLEYLFSFSFIIIIAILLFVLSFSSFVILVSSVLLLSYIFLLNWIVWKLWWRILLINFVSLYFCNLLCAPSFLFFLHIQTRS